MSHISHERLIEMEAEMDRFEQEIQAGEDLPKVIIGSNTYSQVSAQLKMLRAASGITPEQRERKHKEVADQLRMLRARAERDSSPPAEAVDQDCDRSRMLGRDDDPPSKKLPIDPSFLAPPPPPPPILGATPAFVPHQVKHRPPPPPNRPPGPPRMRPPPPRFGGPMGHGLPGPGPGMMHGGPPGGMQGGPGGPGPFPGPRFGPMGPGPGPGPMRPMGPPMGGPMGPMGPGPGPMGGPRHPELMGDRGGGGGGMYAVSSGEEHNDLEKKRKEKEKEEEDNKPKVIYSSAPVITVQKPKKEKKKKKKKKEVEAEESETKTEDPSEQSMELVEPETSAPIISTVSMPPDIEDDFEVADMELDNPVAQFKKEKKEKKKKYIRMAAGQTWEDQSLHEWDTDDFRLFCGDLGNEVSDEVLARAFSKYPSFIKSKVVRDKRTNKTRGYGFVSFRDPTDYVRAMREMNGKYVGNRPIKLRKSTWKDRQKETVIKKEKEKKRLGLR